MLDWSVEVSSIYCMYHVHTWEISIDAPWIWERQDTLPTCLRVLQLQVTVRQLPLQISYLNDQQYSVLQASSDSMADWLHTSLLIDSQPASQQESHRLTSVGLNGVCCSSDPRQWTWCYMTWNSQVIRIEWMAAQRYGTNSTMYVTFLQGTDWQTDSAGRVKRDRCWPSRQDGITPRVCCDEPWSINLLGTRRKYVVLRQASTTNDCTYIHTRREVQQRAIHSDVAFRTTLPPTTSKT